MTVAPEPFALTLEQIEAQLRQDPVLVTEMMGNGAYREVDAALHAKAAQVESTSGIPVYVVLTRTPNGYGSESDQELTSLLHAALGRDGVYYVHTSLGSGYLRSWGDLDPAVENDSILLSNARYTASTEVFDRVRDQLGEDVDVTPAAEAGVVLDLAAGLPGIPDYDEQVLTEDQQQAYLDPMWTSLGYRLDDPAEPLAPVTPGLAALVGVLVGVVVTATAYRALRAVGSPTPSPRATKTRGRGAGQQAEVVRRGSRAGRDQIDARQLDEARERARAAIADLSSMLAGPRAAHVPPERLEVATQSLDAAERLVASDALLDVVGADVLARTGHHALVTDDGSTYRPCFLDPRHGTGRHRAPVAGGLDVPVCRPCQRAVQRGTQLHPLRERLGGLRYRPYYEGTSVWARAGFGTLTDELWRDVQRGERP